jgi:hypothetical protein
MGRDCFPLDNATAESFNSTLEHELLSRHRFATKTDARRAVGRFIDAYAGTAAARCCRPSPTNSSSPNEPPTSTR